MANAQKPVELILARNLASSISTPVFLVDTEGVLVFFNEAAGGLLGRRFEEVGKMAPDEWGSAFQPADEGGEVIPVEKLPFSIALREQVPAHARLRIRSLKGVEHKIEVSALPLIGAYGFQGALALFWPIPDGDG